MVHEKRKVKRGNGRGRGRGKNLPVNVDPNAITSLPSTPDLQSPGSKGHGKEGSGKVGGAGEHIEASTSNMSATSFTCFTCKMIGHISRDCPRASRNTAGFPVISDSVASCPCRIQKLHCEHFPEPWLIDTGATRHMVKIKHGFITYNERDVYIQLAARQNKVRGLGVGDMRVEFKTVRDGAYSFNMILKNVIYCPDLEDNLLSVPELLNQQFRFVIEDEKLSMLLNDYTPVIVAPNKLNQMFAYSTSEQASKIMRMKQVFQSLKLYFESQQGQQGTNQSSGLCTTGMRSDKCTISRRNHLRWGHVAYSTLNNMAKHKVIEDFDENLSPEKCDVCTRVLQFLKPLQSLPSRLIQMKQSTKPLELLHVHLSGPNSTPCVQGANYILTIVDDYTRKIFVRITVDTATVVDVLIEFIRYVQISKKAKVLKVQTDNGIEFTNTVLETFYRQEGIRHQRTTVAAPQSNGVAEGADRMVRVLALSLMVESRLPGKFWGEAVTTAAHLRNIVSKGHYRRSWKTTPHELWYGRKPSAKHLRVFGSYVYKLPERGELEPSREPGILVGYGYSLDQYRIYLPAKGIVETVRSLELFESLKGATLLPFDSNLPWRSLLFPKDEHLDDSSSSALSPSPSSPARKSRGPSLDIGATGKRQSFTSPPEGTMLVASPSEDEVNIVSRQTIRKIPLMRIRSNDARTTIDEYSGDFEVHRIVRPKIVRRSKRLKV